jgi:hypothetical protein
MRYLGRKDSVVWLDGYLEVAHFSIPAKPVNQNARHHIPEEGNFHNIFLLLSRGFFGSGLLDVRS